MAKDKKKKSKKSKVKDEALDVHSLSLADRTIPFVDGMMGPKQKVMTDSELEEFFEVCHVSKFVHTTNVDGSKRSLKFEFGEMLSQHRDAYVDDDDTTSTVYKLSHVKLTKGSFINNISNTIRHINYFIEYFDDDNELMTAYFILMFQIMHNGTNLTIDGFNDTVCAAFTTPTMIDKVCAMVEHNVDEGMIKAPNRVYDASIQMTVDHLKAIMAMSIIHKFSVPIVNHYYAQNKVKLSSEGIKDKDLLTLIFKSFIDTFDQRYNVCMHNKLYHTASAKISKTANSDKLMWGLLEATGVNQVSFTSTMLSDYMVDVSQKIIFSQSAINYVNVCFDNAVRHELDKQYKYDFTTMNITPQDNSSDAMDAYSIWQSNKAFHSEDARIYAGVAIKDTIRRIGRDWNINFKGFDKRGAAIEVYRANIKAGYTVDSDGNELKRPCSKRDMIIWDEYKYYRDNIPRPMHDAQLYIVMLYAASKLNSSKVTEMLSMSDLTKIIMVMVRDLESRNFTYLSYFITGTLDAHHVTRFIRSKVEKLFTSHSRYDEWLEEYTDTLEVVGTTRMYDNLKTMLSSAIRPYHYNHPEYEGKIMKPQEIQVVDEFMRFIMQL